MRPAVVLAIVLGAGWPVAIADAGPPVDPPADPTWDTKNTGEDEPPGLDGPVGGPLIWDEPGGFWLSLELIGPRGAQIDAARSLAQPPVIDALPRGGSPPPGELVGRVDTLEQALSWVNANSFATLGAGEAATPVPGGYLYRDHELILTALVVTPGSNSSTHTFPWPPANVLPIPAGAAWQPASLAVARAPMFAAPAPQLPPASERYQIVNLDDAVWLLDSVDRCDDAGACLRWAQILVRRGDRFFGGWVPATQVVPDSAWVGGPGERRFALLPSYRTRADAGFALLEQHGGSDQREPALGLHRAHAGAAWPSAAVQVLGEDLVALISGDPVLTRHIGAAPPTLPLP
ncbi:hypothetical protein DB30_02401 [Enhygromyxa salina]|uniref:Uncharacterized protein n=1 Tax=Enhygromyxa salina TaxID=215803 RepID=A0A0C1Z2V6_9BACT|nr:hypothetical protein [Enhygromyxa salina]KIG11849.1 hypothetical protein DB30_02401 [Enhygromyxa salina]